LITVATATSACFITRQRPSESITVPEAVSGLGCEDHFQRELIGTQSFLKTFVTVWWQNQPQGQVFYSLKDEVVKIMSGESLLDHKLARRLLSLWPWLTPMGKFASGSSAP